MTLSPKQMLKDATSLIRKDREMIYAELKRIAEKSAVQDCQRLAILIMQTMELERDGKIATPLPPTHHA